MDWISTILEVVPSIQRRHFSSISSSIFLIRLYSGFFVSFALGFPICWLSMNLPTCFMSMPRLVQKSHQIWFFSFIHLGILEVRLVALAMEVARAEFSISTAIVFFPSITLLRLSSL